MSIKEIKETMNRIGFSFANADDEIEIKELLQSCGLHNEDINPGKLRHFIIAKKETEIAGVIGIEKYNEIGLLRSLAVKPLYRSINIGKLLMEKIIAYAYQKGITQIFLFTKNTDKFFENFGFRITDRKYLPEQICNTTQFKEFCSASTLCMFLETVSHSIHFTQDTLQLHPIVDGAKMWTVFLKQCMLTYFEIKPNSIFTFHRHHSEQITMVLEGILYICIDKRIVEVKKGEVIAIPSDHIHSAFTKKDPVKAIDAWAPVRIDYKNLHLQ